MTCATVQLRLKSGLRWWPIRFENFDIVMIIKFIAANIFYTNLVIFDFRAIINLHLFNENSKMTTRIKISQACETIYRLLKIWNNCEQWAWPENITITREVVQLNAGSKAWLGKNKASDISLKKKKTLLLVCMSSQAKRNVWNHIAFIL